MEQDWSWCPDDAKDRPLRRDPAMFPVVVGFHVGSTCQISSCFGFMYLNSRRMKTSEEVVLMIFTSLA